MPRGPRILAIEDGCRAQVVIETPKNVLISKVLWERYLLTIVLDSSSNIARVMRDFDETAERILELLR